MSFRQLIKIFTALFIGLFFFGCSSRSYAPYPSYQQDYYPRKSTKINNSSGMRKATMRPYSVGGVTYYPTTVSVGDTFSGIASWYGRDFHGKKTSNGEYYNMYDMTAASKTLPMNTMLKVTNLNNLKSAVVRINDRGPFVKTRIIDLSYAAASRLGVVARGTAPVRLEVIGFGGVINHNKSKVQSVTIGNYLVQIGAFRRKNGANRYAKRYTTVLSRYNSIIKRYMLDGYPIYRVYLSGFKSQGEARDFIAKGMFAGAFIIQGE